MLQDDKVEESQDQEETQSPDQTEAESDTGTETNSDQGQQDQSEEDYVELPGGEKVTLDELKKGYMRTSDYTKKTQEVSKARQEIEQQRQQRAESGGSSRYTPEEAAAIQQLDKLGVPTLDKVEDVVRRMLATNSIVNERSKIQAEYGFDDPMMNAVQVLAVGRNQTISEAAKDFFKTTGGIKRKGLSVNGGVSASSQSQGKAKYSLSDIKKMDPNSKEFDEVVKLMEEGKL